MDNKQAFETIKPAIRQELTDIIFEAKLDGYRSFPKERISGLVDTAVDKMQADVNGSDTSEFATYWEAITRQRFSQGIPLDSVLRVIELADGILVKHVLAEESFTNEKKLELLPQVHRIIRSAIVSMYHVYEDSYNSLLLAQESAIRELSTPIVPIHEGVLVLPLVGSIDSARASTIMEELLEAITRYQADVVIMDITGVPVIDTGIANYLLQAARAVRLLGSQIVLVGISAEIAQTIVQLGIDLTGITTRANLQSGIEFALGLLDLAISHQSQIEHGL